MPIHPLETSPSRHFIPGCLIALTLAIGCDRPEPVVVYTIPTEVPAEFQQERSRMLAAMIPSGDLAWFLKVTGPETAIDLVADDFRRFAEEIKIEDGEPQLDDLPKGWKRDSGQQSQFRFATINVDTPKKQLDISVSQLGKQSDWDAMVAMNVNRWRGQMGLASSEDQWAEGQPIEITAADGASVWVDIAGDSKAGSPSMKPPFAGKGAAPFASGARPAMVPPMPPPSDLTAKNPPMKEDPRLGFDRPEGWRDGRMSSMRMAAFNVGPDDAPAEITVIPAGGDLRGNVARWLGQIRSKQVPDDVVDQAMKAASEVKVDGRDAKRFFLAGDEADAGNAIDATIVPLGGGPAGGNMSLFIKMTGPRATVEAQAENIAEFLASLKLKM